MESEEESVAVERIRIRVDVDVQRARRAARRLATDLGLDRNGAEMVVLAVSELGTNLIRYARGGEITLSTMQDERGARVLVESRDDGPGIADVDQAMANGSSTGGGLGGGLGAVRRLMDEFAIVSDASGTRVRACKWVRKSERGCGHT
ncbi:MAG: ATP-binding protein [Chloroflexi bacterium]|nr:ATP-binding protein [Chloroflexota bacterium]